MPVDIGFGKSKTLHSPVKDFTTIRKEQLYHIILPFIHEGEKAGEKTVVHCSAGMGRTGQVMSAWLTRFRDMKPNEALETVLKTGRNPLEAQHRSEWESPAKKSPRYGSTSNPTDPNREIRTYTPGKTGRTSSREEWSDTWPPDRREWPTNKLRLNPPPEKKPAHFDPW